MLLSYTLEVNTCGLKGKEEKLHKKEAKLQGKPNPTGFSEPRMVLKHPAKSG